jgi:hypothetical protein
MEGNKNYLISFKSVRWHWYPPAVVYFEFQILLKNSQAGGGMGGEDQNTIGQQKI